LTTDSDLTSRGATNAIKENMNRRDFLRVLAADEKVMGFEHRGN